jgi:hypothetical protein
MFWSKDKDKQSKPSNSPASKAAPDPERSDRIRQEALANARIARAEIGEETLDKIAALMTKKQQSAIEMAKADIAKADADRVAQEILWMLEQK